MTTKFWPMEPGALAQYREFKKSLKNVDLSQMESYTKFLQDEMSSELTIVNRVAVIPVRGVLGNRTNFFSFLFSSSRSSYLSITREIGLAVASSDVDQIQLQVNSPGGQLDGLFDLLYAIKAASKPVEAIVETRADSAAYGIVSQADKIIGASELSEVGSVGVAVQMFVYEDEIDITSSDAPNKWPDPKTVEGVSVIKAELDEIHVKFATIIAEGRAAATGRPITEKIVNTDFGRGGTMLAEAGLEAGMIDEIIPTPDRVSNAAFFTNNSGNAPSGLRSETNQDNKKMDLNELKLKHPETYAAAVAEAQAAERNRVAALLKTGQACGKTEYAIECVEKGLSIKDDIVQAEFLTARINKKDVEKREEDDAPPITPPDSQADKTDEEKTTAEYLKRRGAKKGLKAS